MFKTALKEGALMSTLSGSGSTLFSMAYVDDCKNLEKALKLRFLILKYLLLTLITLV